MVNLKQHRDTVELQFLTNSRYNIKNNDKYMNEALNYFRYSSKIHF